MRYDTKDEPAWMDQLVLLWAEDDACTPDAEPIRKAWERLFEEKFSEAKNESSYDAGDATFYLFSEGRVACLSYPGNSAIYVHQVRGS